MPYDNRTRGAKSFYAMCEYWIVKEGALADLLLVNGDPLTDIDLIRDPDKNFTVIMKNGVIYKNANGLAPPYWGDRIARGQGG
jgi:hypothetical protein